LPTPIFPHRAAAPRNLCSGGRDSGLPTTGAGGGATLRWFPGRAYTPPP